MKRTAISILLLLSILFLFACGNDYDMTETDGTENGNEETEETMGNIDMDCINGGVKNPEEENNATEDGGTMQDGVKMTAKIDELGEKITVTVIESEYAYGVYWVITGNTDFYGKDGEKITKSELSIGDTVEIIYNGQVMMSYPPQIVALKITVLDD